jgi:hypothetical protein
MTSQWLFCTHYQYVLPTCGACLEVGFDLERRAAFGSLRVELILAPLGMPK